jgi:hypothetical protein
MFRTFMYQAAYLSLPLPDRPVNFVPCSLYRIPIGGNWVALQVVVSLPTPWAQVLTIWPFSIHSTNEPGA